MNDALLALPGRSHGLVDIGTCNLHICHNAFGKGLGVFANEISEFVIDRTGGSNNLQHAEKTLRLYSKNWA